jgi:uncharacterized protein YfeS
LGGVGTVLLAIVLTGCGTEQLAVDPAGAGASTVAAADSTTSTSQTTMEPDVLLHPRFADHFTADVYSDLGAQFGPFGSDEGYDMLSEWSGRSIELSPSSTVRDLLAGADEDADDEDAGSVDSVFFDVLDSSADPADDAVDEATLVLGAGFTLLRLTGQIDAEGEQVTLEALDAVESFYGSQPEFDQMRQDLLTFTGPTEP